MELRNSGAPRNTDAIAAIKARGIKRGGFGGNAASTSQVNEIRRFAGDYDRSDSGRGNISGLPMLGYELDAIGR